MFSELICNLLGHFWVYSTSAAVCLSVCLCRHVCVSLVHLALPRIHEGARASFIACAAARNVSRSHELSDMMNTSTGEREVFTSSPNITYRVLISTLYNRLKHTSSKIEKSRVFPRGSDWKAEFTSKHLFWAVIACSNKQPDNHVGRKFKLSFFRFKILSANSY